MERFNTVQKMYTFTRYTSYTMLSAQNVGITLTLSKCQRPTDNFIDFYLLFCYKKAHDNREFSHEISKPCSESQITIH